MSIARIAVESSGNKINPKTISVFFGLGMNSIPGGKRVSYILILANSVLWCVQNKEPSLRQQGWPMLINIVVQNWFPPKVVFIAQMT